MAHMPMTKRKKSDHDIHKFQGKESILTSQINIYVDEAQPKIPDGGWGWMVVFAAFILNTISEGVSFSFGLLLIEFLNEFKASKSATSLVGSLFLALPLLAGPLGSALVDRYGCIKMTILGSLICTTGFILSVFANSIGMLYITFGIIGGVGRGLTFVTAVVSIAFWFEKKRTIALGLAASGAGVGTIVFAPLTTLFLSEYGWRGTMLMLAGCFFQMCVSGAVMRDPKWIIEEERERKSIKANTNAGKLLTEDGKNGDVYFHLEKVNTSRDVTEKKWVRSAIDLPTFLKENEKVPFEVLKQLSEKEEINKIILKNYPNLNGTESTSNQDMQAHSNDNFHSKVKFSEKVKKTVTAEATTEENEGQTDTEISNNNAHPLLSSSNCDQSKTKSSSHSYLHQIKLKRLNSVDCSNKDMLNLQKSEVTTSSPEVYRSTVTETPEKAKWYIEFFRSLKTILNFSLFLELHFFILAISTTILFIWFIVPYFYLAEHMIRIGYSEDQAAFALSTIGLTNTLGMVLLGWTGDRINISKMYALCLLLCGISIASMMYFTGNYIMLLVNSGFFGIFFASCFSLLPSLVADLVPLEDFTMAYGLILMCMGVGNLTGPPLAGFLFDLTDSWEQSFYQAAVWIIISGLLVGIIPFTKNRKMIGSGPILIEKVKSDMNGYSL